MPLVIAMATVGVALAVLIVGLFAWLRLDARRMEDRLREDMRRMEDRLREDNKRLAQEVSDLRERMAHLEGLLEGLREAIVAKAA